MNAAKARRRPTQARAQATYDVILRAAAQVLLADGFSNASTNRIAKVAGVSVGSLYQYFGNKEGVYAALIDHYCDAQIELLVRMADQLVDVPLVPAVETYVQAMIATHQRESPIHTALSQQAAHLGVGPVRRIQRESRRVVRRYLARHADAIMPTDLDLATFVLVGLVEGIVDGAISAEAAPAWPDLADEIVQAVLRYLLGPAVGQP